VLVGERIRSAGTRGDSSLPQNVGTPSASPTVTPLRQEPPDSLFGYDAVDDGKRPEKEHTIAGQNGFLNARASDRKPIALPIAFI